MNNIISCVHFDASGTLEGMLAGIQVSLQESPSSLLVLIAEASATHLEQLPELFSNLPTPVVGLVVPRLLMEGRLLDEGVLILGLRPVIVTRVFNQIDRPGHELQVELLQQLEGLNDTLSAMLIVDGTSKGLDDFIQCVHDLLGPDTIVAGFGAGYSDFSPRPSIITSSGLRQNAALLSFIPAPLSVEVNHGWKKLAGPFLVTHAEDNLIHSINYRPALSFYQEAVESLTGERIPSDGFYRYSAYFPFGMEQFEGEFLVRDPTNHKGNAIECAGMVPANAMVYILQADAKALCEAAGEAAQKLSGKISSQCASDNAMHILVIDCISRWMVLGDDFDKELQAIHSRLPDGAKMIGLLSLGELASSSQGLVQLLNKTTVLVGPGK
jgi:hypothetical protein